MLQLKAAAAWLAAIHPSLPWVLLTVALWLVQYLTRKTKLGAIVWEFAANAPFPTDSRRRSMSCGSFGRRCQARSPEP